MSDRPTPEECIYDSSYEASALGPIGNLARYGYRIGRDVKPTRFRPVLYANGEGFATTDAADAWRDGYNAAIHDIFGEADDE